MALRRPGAAGQGDRRQAGRRRLPGHLGARARPARGRRHRRPAAHRRRAGRRGRRAPTATRRSPTLLHDDGPFFVGHYYVDAVRAVELVRAAGGVPVFAHPAAAHRGDHRRRRRDPRDGRRPGWPGSRSTTATTRPTTGTGCARSPPSWACWSPAPATTTAPARPTGSARTPPTPRCFAALLEQATESTSARRERSVTARDAADEHRRTSSSSSRSSSRCS